MRWFRVPDPDRPELAGVLEFDGSPPLELHLYDGYAEWIDADGNVLVRVDLTEA